MKTDRSRLAALLAAMTLAWSAAHCSSSTGAGADAASDAGASDAGVGDAGAGDAGAGDAGAGDAGAADPGCRLVLNQADAATGFESCSDGTTRRLAATMCPTERVASTSPCMPMPHDCASDSDCTMQPLGYCATSRLLAGYCGCYYGCRQDSDCAAGSICECGVVVGQCVPATCRTNADCAAGRGCIATANSTTGSACGATRSFACQTANDQCASDADCAGGACLFDGTHRACGTGCPMHP
jgi:hypothetical protein